MGLEDDLNDLYTQLESIQDILKSSPDNNEILALQTELNTMISALEEQLGTTKKPTTTTTTTTTASQPESSSNSATTKKRPANGAPVTQETAPPPPHITYNVGDSVQARWVSGDNSFYPARITSITGSTKNPVYIVTYTSYGTTETLSSKDIRPAQNVHTNKKARTSPPAQQQPQPSVSSSHSTPVPASSAVISQAPTLNTNALSAKQAEAKPASPLDGNPEKKKTKKASKFAQELDQSKKKWADFAAKGVKSSRSGKAKKIGESSMFRVPEGVHGRVGFTGSGQPMRKDVARERHIYQQGEGNED